jgi:hypothetical protein
MQCKDSGARWRCSQNSTVMTYHTDLVMHVVASHDDSQTFCGALAKCHPSRLILVVSRRRGRHRLHLGCLQNCCSEAQSLNLSMSTNAVDSENILFSRACYSHTMSRAGIWRPYNMGRDWILRSNVQHWASRKQPPSNRTSAWVSLSVCSEDRSL